MKKIKATDKTVNLLDTCQFIKGTIGDENSPGNCIVHYSLVVVQEESKVSGIVEINPYVSNINSIKLNVAGNIRDVGYGNLSKIITLNGEYSVPVSSQNMGSYTQFFSAYLDVDNKWNGFGGFSYGNERIENVSVTNKN